MKTLNASRVRVPVVVISLVWLFFAIIHGPGRGMSAVPPDLPMIDMLGYLQVLTGVLLCSGLLLLNPFPKLALNLLGLGLVGRASIEVLFSSVRNFIHAVAHQFLTNESVLIWVGLLSLFYLATWIFPALIFLERIRKFRSSTANVSTVVTPH